MILEKKKKNAGRVVVPAARYMAGEIAWHRWDWPVSGVVPVATITGDHS